MTTPQRDTAWWNYFFSGVMLDVPRQSHSDRLGEAAEVLPNPLTDRLPGLETVALLGRVETDALAGAVLDGDKDGGGVGHVDTPCRGYIMPQISVQAKLRGGENGLFLAQPVRKCAGCLGRPNQPIATAYTLSRTQPGPQARREHHTAIEAEDDHTSPRRFEALEPIRQRVREHFGGFTEAITDGLELGAA